MLYGKLQKNTSSHFCNVNKICLMEKIELIIFDKLRYFVVIGRAKPTETNQNPKIYKLKVFCRNDVKAKSLFWKHMANFDRIKKTQGQILAVHRILDRDPTRVKNFGFWLKYRSRMGIHNMYREYRDVTVDSAAQKLYDDMAGRHKAKPDNIHIIDCREISDHQVKRPRVRQFLVCTCYCNFSKKNFFSKMGFNHINVCHLSATLFCCWKRELNYFGHLQWLDFVSVGDKKNCLALICCQKSSIKKKQIFVSKSANFLTMKKLWLSVFNI
ncbi:ribosomal protein L18a, component of cytosolic 80S ribosome and 60S large subunit [Reticulomyxa filosa]|uniref:Ribosomal protein L18a, component of cytosolic 80S ribosome and 60S large subunit n=1 Tax=Reticulomyxa filosa TaxID=46433 RepID=X6P452_RETFI|nr:ribosomal protein L18a, component of cytosolic 80S ribosome and 60S large subunit [Reticulomyxa filosa]|eukprot:ETO32991.1 ribosomal protein L18a, component of cytosolic 80S ribosome and 60S large subunit [Reticulomyxa filosa]